MYEIDITLSVKVGEINFLITKVVPAAPSVWAAVMMVIEEIEETYEKQVDDFEVIVAEIREGNHNVH